MKRVTSLFCGILLASSLFANERKIFKADDFGACPDSPLDNTAAIAKAIDAAKNCGGPAEVRLSAGVYRVKNDNKPTEKSFAAHCFSISQANDIIISGSPDGTTKIIVTNPVNGLFRLQKCQNIVFRDFTVDYEPLPFTQGELVNIDLDKHTYDVKIDDHFELPDQPYFQQPLSAMAVDSSDSTPTLPPGETVIRYGGPPEDLGNRTWRFISGGNWMKTFDANAAGEDPLRSPYIKKGAKIVFSLRLGGNIFTMGECSNIEMRNLTVHTAPGFFALIMMGRDFFFYHCKVTPPPGSNRARTTTGDGFHLKNTRGRLVVENCRIENAGDDSINFHATGLYAEKVISDTEVLLNAGGWGGMVKTGDRLQFIDQKAGLRGEAMVKAVENQPGGKYLTTLAAPIAGIRDGEKKEGYLVFNLDGCPKNFLIKDNYLASQTGILARGMDGVIQGNTFVATSFKQAICLGYAGFPWFEGPIPGKIQIIDNTFIGGRYCQLDIPKGVNNLTISDNRFVKSTGQIMSIDNALNIAVTDNVITGDDTEYSQIKPYPLINIRGKSDHITVKNLTVTENRKVITRVINTEESAQNIKIEAIKLNGKELSGKEGCQ